MSLKDIFKKDKDKDKAASTLAGKASEKPVVKDSRSPSDKAEPSTRSVSDVKNKTKPQTVEPLVKGKEGSIISHQVLIKPLVTEKGARLADQGKYLFMVNKNANKIMIARAIEETYGVKVVKVNVINYTGKHVRYGRQQGKRKDWKKALITLSPGQTIEVYKGV